MTPQPDGPSAPDVIRVADAAPPRKVTKLIRKVLAAGGIVALPTETVYGLAARADDERALATLRELKGRPDPAPFTWHVAARDVVETATALVPLARRLAQRYWPGPLTLVLRSNPPGLERVTCDGWTGMRLPAHGATRRVIESLDFPVVLTSANPHGAEPLTDPAAVAGAFGTRIGLVVDGGPARIGEASGVLLVGPGRFDLLRPGLFTLDDLRRTAGRRIGFVCTGNTCRSPMAEGLTRDLLARRLGVAPERIGEFGFELVSMGVFAAPGSPASRHAIEVMRERDVDISAHESRAALSDVVGGLDEVYCLTEAHRSALTRNLPPGKAKHLKLLDVEGRDVPDPIGGSRDDYRRCAESILASIEKRAEDWA